MTLLSTLCRANRISNSINKAYVSRLFLVKEQNAFKQAIRKMSGGEDRTFHITPSRFQYTKFKDDLHFYVTLGLVPLGLLILFINIFIGPATLTEIPEGYVPEHWEYYNHPIKRFIAKHFQDDPQINHEKVLHALREENAKHEWRATIDKVLALQLERNDYKGIYYIPSDQGRHYRYARKMYDELEEYRGYR